jgi:pyruvate/2-oxoglutarate dehydrogenase complex dihydrolipoamide dehydrogenase (E3) component
MIFGLGVAIQAELTIDDITDVIFPHPSISESILEASMAVLGKPIHS